MKTKVNENQYIELYYNDETLLYSWSFLPQTKFMTVEEIKDTFRLMMNTMH